MAAQQRHDLGDIALAVLQGTVQALRLEGFHLLGQRLHRQRPQVLPATDAQGVALSGVDQFTYVARPVICEQAGQFGGARAGVSRPWRCAA